MTNLKQNPFTALGTVPTSNVIENKWTMLDSTRKQTRRDGPAGVTDDAPAPEVTGCVV